MWPVKAVDTSLSVQLEREATNKDCRLQILAKSSRSFSNLQSKIDNLQSRWGNYEPAICRPMVRPPKNRRLPVLAFRDRPCLEPGQRRSTRPARRSAA